MKELYFHWPKSEYLEPPGWSIFGGAGCTFLFGGSWTRYRGFRSLVLNFGPFYIGVSNYKYE